MPGADVRHGGPANTRLTGPPVARVLVDVDRRGISPWSA